MAMDSLLSQSVNLIAPKKADIVLDLGAGCGFLGYAFADQVKQCVSVDISINMLWEAQKLNIGKSVHEIAFIQGNAEQLPFADEVFSIIGSRYLWHYLHNPKQVLNEIQRILKPSGRLLLIDRVTEDNPKKQVQQNALEKLRNPTFECIHAVSEIESQLSASRFKIVKILRAEKEVEGLAWCESAGLNNEATLNIFDRLKSDIKKNTTGLKPFFTAKKLYIKQKSAAFIATYKNM
jgi:ubiquinone/menaquinone biosynthesis C-methylase UbiE